MLMTKQDRQSLNRMSLLFGQSLKTTKEFFESLAIFITLKYADGQDIDLHFLGRVTLQYKGDRVVKGGKEASVHAQLELADFLIRNVGQVEDGVLTDSERLLMERVKNIFSSYEEGTFQLPGNDD